ncbi:GerMN domain-containing protein [Nocardioides panacis]|uniref:GerMN domain-containing protein n=1 Tax=Nocardioides panacis TaxID=2849501 RepID=A0A975XYM0_9ACTN|nr:Gmad2 immunoglobulin-like domain-containing protein [Nocardioides panacis]QWZ06515.1 GerMN domain-containing protein [Nocardioides panacis]
MNDDQLRALLEDAVSDVEPRGSLDDIRSRTTPSRSRRPWVWGAGGAVLATAATIAAVALLSGPPGTTDAGPGPAGTTQATGPQTSATERPARAVTAYFVVQTKRGPLLYPETYAVVGDIQAEQVVERSVTGQAGDPDYGTAWPAGTTLQKAQLSDGVLSVDLAGAPVDRPAGMSQAQAELALDQAVRSAQSAFGSKLPVTFLLDGRPTPTLLGLGTGQPVPAATDEQLSPVQVDAPADGATVDSPFTVTGRAAAFEANVQWELVQGSTVVKQGFTTAEECCTLSPYSFEVTAPPGSYTLVVHDEDASGGAEGTGQVEDTKRVVVR